MEQGRSNIVYKVIVFKVKNFDFGSYYDKCFERAAKELAAEARNAMYSAAVYRHWDDYLFVEYDEDGLPI